MRRWQGTLAGAASEQACAGCAERCRCRRPPAHGHAQAAARPPTLSDSRARSLTLLVWVAENSRVWRWRGMLDRMAFRVAEKPCGTGGGGPGGVAGGASCLLPNCSAAFEGRRVRALPKPASGWQRAPHAARPGTQPQRPVPRAQRAGSSHGGCPSPCPGCGQPRQAPGPAHSRAQVDMLNQGGASPKRN